MKKLLIAIIILANIGLFAVTNKISVQSDEVELKFENVKIKNISFYSGKDIEVKFSKSDNVIIEQSENVVTFSADSKVKINIKLPESKSYIYKAGDSVCKFNPEGVIIQGDDGEIVEFSEGKLVVIDGDETRVEIGDQGIIVHDDDKRVEISSRGIIVESEDENTYLTGFWGRLLGSIIKSVAKTSVSFAGKKPEKIAKYFINDEDVDFSSTYITFDDETEGDELYTEEFYQTYQPAKGLKVNVSNKNGKVVIQTWEEDYIDIYAIKKTRKNEKELEKVEINLLEIDGLTIETKYLSEHPVPKVSVSYEIKVPEDVLLGDIQSSNGKIEIKGVRGESKLSTSNAKIIVYDFDGNLTLHTSNGPINVEDVTGTVTARTSNARITIEDVAKSVKATTSNGTIEIEDSPIITEVITSNAKIRVEIIDLENDVNFITSNGEIKLYFSSSLNANIEATTSNGRINLSDLEVITRSISKNSLSGRIGEGGYTIIARTSNASINLYSIEKLY